MRAQELRVLVVDDERLAREHLVSLLEQEARVDVLGAASDGDVALGMIKELVPDLVFLDIRMRRVSGLDVSERVRRLPTKVIFTTAYSEYALQGFEVGAVDYLKKPFSRSRLRKSLRRAARALRASQRGVEHLFVRDRDQQLRVPVTSLVRIESCDDYVKLITADRRYLLKTTLKKLYQQLDRSHFVRVHRSHLVCLDRIEQAHAIAGRRMRLIMSNGDEVAVSRSFAPELRATLRYRVEPPN